MLHVLADVSNGLERALLHHFGAGGVGDVLDEGGDQAGPQAAGQLHHGDHLDALGGSARSEALSSQSSEDVLLGGEANILRHGQPALLILGPETLVVGVEEVLELDSGLLSADSAVPSVVEDLRQSPETRA